MCTGRGFATGQEELPRYACAGVFRRLERLTPRLEAATLSGRRHDHRGGHPALHDAGPFRTPCTTATSSANRWSFDGEPGAVGVRPRSVPGRPASATPSTSTTSNATHYQVHTGINPTAVVPLGPDHRPAGSRPITGRTWAAGRSAMHIAGGRSPPTRRFRPGQALTHDRPPTDSLTEHKEIHVAKKKKQKLPRLQARRLRWLGCGGTLAGLAFQKTWKVIRHEDDAPDALDPDRGWGRSCSPPRSRAPSSPRCAAPWTGREPRPSNARPVSGRPAERADATDRTGPALPRHRRHPAGSDQPRLGAVCAVRRRVKE